MVLAATTELRSIRLPIDLIREWSTAPAFDEAIDVLARWLPVLMEAKRSSVAILVNGDLEIYKLAGSAIPTNFIVSLESTSIGTVIATQSVLNIGSPADAMHEQEASMLSEIGVTSTLIAPLVSGGECFGTINLGRAGIDAFSEEDELHLAGIAEVLGSTLLALRRVEMQRVYATTDSLTGLANRRRILELLGERLGSKDTCTAVLFIDLDGFKFVNDAYGHATGDLMLKELAERLLHECGIDHDPGRFGGDEFLIVCGQGVDRPAVLSLAERLIESFKKPIDLGAVILQPQLSIGVAMGPSDRTTVAELLAQADGAMYEAKRTGNTLVEADDNLRHAADLVAAIDADLDFALASDSIEFYYQPARNLQTNEILGCEALMRWIHPELGLVPPQLLVARAEATGQIDALTTWAIERVARDWTEVQRSNDRFQDKAVAFNLSARQLAWNEYVDTHMAVLDKYGMRAEDIFVEVVESGMIDVGTTTETTIRALADNGVTIVLDDFGSGYNAIGYFSRFPIHGIKIDRSMVSAMVHNPVVQTVVKGLCQIATDLNISVLGEGIETQAELDACIDAGAAVGQGYFFDHPLPLADFIELANVEFPDTAR